jgi:hypothetical protein
MMRYMRWSKWCVCSLLLCAPAAHGAAGGWVEQGRKAIPASKGLSAAEIKKMTKKEERDMRNKLSMRRIRPASGTGDWATDPTAIPFMLYQVNKRTDLPVYVDNEGLDAGSDELFEYLVVYLTSHYAWALNQKETENLSKWLRRGGTLFLDDCYNRGSPFSDSVGPEVGKMIPGAVPKMMVKTDEHVKDVFSMVYQTLYPGENIKAGRPWQYYLLDGRPAVFFTPNDDGCGWEISTPPTASNPIGEGIGHGGDNTQRELFYKWTTNWMMYVYSH